MLSSLLLLHPVDPGLFISTPLYEIDYPSPFFLSWNLLCLAKLVQRDRVTEEVFSLRRINELEEKASCPLALSDTAAAAQSLRYHALHREVMIVGHEEKVAVV